MLTITNQLKIPLAEFVITFARSSGPGGQNVNKVNSKATLRWSPQSSPSLPEAVRERFRQRFGSRLTGEGELLISSQRYRDAGRNQQDCINKLRAMLLEVAKPAKTRRVTRRTQGSVERRLQGKKRRSSSKAGRRIQAEE